MEGKEDAGEEVVDAVDEEEEEDADLGILILVVMINGKLQASMKR